jgi:hypothetical protein
MIFLSSRLPVNFFGQIDTLTTREWPDQPSVLLQRVRECLVEIDASADEVFEIY